MPCVRNRGARRPVGDAGMRERAHPSATREDLRVGSSVRRDCMETESHVVTVC